VRCSVVVLGSVLSPLCSSHIKREFPCRKVSLDKATTTGGCQETGGGEGWFVLVPFTTITFIYHSVIVSFGEICVSGLGWILWLYVLCLGVWGLTQQGELNISKSLNVMCYCLDFVDAIGVHNLSCWHTFSRDFLLLHCQISSVYGCNDFDLTGYCLWCGFVYTAKESKKVDARK